MSVALVDSLACLSRLICTIPAATPGHRIHIVEGDGRVPAGREGQIGVFVRDLPQLEVDAISAVQSTLESIPGCLSAIYFPTRSEVVAWFTPAGVA